MDNMVLFTKIIPAIMIFCIVFFNLRKLQKTAKAMKQVHGDSSGCSGCCSGCSHSAGCQLPEKEEFQAKDKTE